MHKPVDRDKKRSRIRDAIPVSRAQRPLNVSDLLAKSKIGGKEIPQFSDQQEFWRKFLSERLEPELFSAIAGVVERDSRLTVQARSAAWAARLRFAMADLWPQLRAARATLRECVVRVQPAAADSIRART